MSISYHTHLWIDCYVLRGYVLSDWQVVEKNTTPTTISRVKQKLVIGVSCFSFGFLELLLERTRDVDAPLHPVPPQIAGELGPQFVLARGELDAAVLEQLAPGGEVSLVSLVGELDEGLPLTHLQLGP